MEPLLEAIYTQCKNTAGIVTAFPAFVDSTTGGAVTYPVGVYADEAPERATLPYMVTSIIAAPATTRYGGIQRTEPQIQFAAYGVGRAAGYARMLAFINVFDELTLTLSSGKMVNTTRLGSPVPALDPSKDETGQNVWQWTVVYQFVLNQ